MGDQIKKLFEKEGKKGVERFRASIIEGDRVASGAALDSIESEVTQDKGTVSLVIRAAGIDYIKNLELGMTAGEVQAQASEEGAQGFYSQIVAWSNSRGIESSHAESITTTLLSEGWNQDRPNRTGQNGGTKGILSDPGKETIKQIKKGLLKASKSDLLISLKEGFPKSQG